MLKRRMCHQLHLLTVLTGITPSCLISCSHSSPEGACGAELGGHGAMKPAGRARGRNDMASYRRGSDRSRVGPPRGLSAIQQMANVSPQIRAALRRGANLRPERRPPDVAALIGKAPTDTIRLGRQFLTNIKRSRHRRAMVNPRGLLLALPLGLGIDGWCICTNYIQIIVGSSCFSSCGAFAPSRTTVE